jgi:polyhydroxybutyrate depolymerase
VALALLPLALQVGGVASPATASDESPASVLTGTEQAPGGVAGHDELVSLSVDGLSRSYRLFVPSSLGSSPARLLVMLHPLHGSPLAMETVSELDVGAASLGVLVAYPAGVGNSWNAGTCCSVAQLMQVNDVSFLDAVLDDVQRRYPVDLAKIAMGGFSNGGLMTYRYACEHSARIATFVVASGVPVPPTCSFVRPIAVLDMHGLADPVVPWRGSRTSPYTASGWLPGVQRAVSSIAAKDGCAGRVTTLLASGATRRQAIGCPTGAAVDLFTSPNMGHFWVTGAAASTFHLDETGLTWSFLLSH